MVDVEAPSGFLNFSQEKAAVTQLPESGDPGKADLEALYREMLPQIYRFTSARLGADDGRDVASEVFHAAVVAFTDGRAAQVTPAWLMVVAKNKVIDRWRMAERRGAIAMRFLPRADDLAEFPQDWFENSQRDAVLRALGRMATKERSLLVLHYLDGIATHDLAAQLDVSHSALESRLARARRKFRSYYEAEPAPRGRRADKSRGDT
jgi:RNA polymerase sigma factor (sigma-70 family)